MRIVYWLLTVLALALVVIGFGFFAAPENANVSTEDLIAWYLQAVIIGAIIGGVSGASIGALVPRVVAMKRGETPASFSGRVVSWGLGGGVLAVTLTVLVTMQLAYSQSTWQLSPSERMTLVSGNGRYFGVLGAAWFTASVVFAAMISGRSWNGRGALTGR